MAETITIDLWVWSLALPDTETARLASVLSPDEQARAVRFLSAAHGAMYIAGRGRLRQVLSSYTAVAAETLQFVYGASGKPQLSGISGAPHFNLSHTGTLAALAVTANHPLGIDIEAERPLKEDIARRFFSESEVAALAAHPPDARIAAFYRCWTRKEAFIKATGDGLGFPLDAFDVTLDAATPAMLTRIEGCDAIELSHWRLLQIDPANLRPGVAGSVALRTTDAASVVVMRPCQWPTRQWP